MRLRQEIQSKSRDPQFLWRMVISLLACGLVLGYLVRKEPPPTMIAAPDQFALNKVISETERAAADGRWLEVWWGSGRIVLSRAEDLGPVILGLVTGCCWLAFVMQSLRIVSLWDGRFWLALTAVPLGMFSIWINRFLDYWQQYSWGLHQSDSLLGGLRYLILGVGLREELSKLICLLPLMPIFLRWRNAFTALMVSCCVGLGFALTENVNYFRGSLGSDALGRYLTANPFHMTLTGLVGLAVYRASRSPREWGAAALATFGAMVFAHGLYDAFGYIPVLSEYSLFGIIIFALIVYQFFRELRELRPPGRDTVSLSANFLCSVSLVTSMTFVYLSLTQNWSIALDVIVPEVLGMAIMVYLFLREMPETMIEV